MKTQLTTLLGIELPIIQAPMAGVSTTAMAAAVSNAGGLGSIPLGALNADKARQALREVRSQTDAPIAVNLFVHPTPVRDPDREAQFLAELRADFEAVGSRPPTELLEIYTSFNDDDAMLEMLLEERPPVVSLHFGPATNSRMEALKGAGIIVLATATTVEEAKLLTSSGVDVLVMQGYGAGGHSGAFLSEPDPSTSGREGVTRLIESTAAVVDTPLVAAGGLMTGQDIRAMLDAGAAGAQLGTAFIGCPESLADEIYRQWLGRNPRTRMISAISGRPARGLENNLMLRMMSVKAPLPDYPITYDGIKQLIAVTSEPGFSVMWAGEGAARVRSLPAAELIDQIAREMVA